MPSYLCKGTAITQIGKIPRGATIQVISSGCRPTPQEICAAIKAQLGIDLKPSTNTSCFFKWEQVK